MTLLPVQPRLDQTINSDAPRGKEARNIFHYRYRRGGTPVSRGEHIVNHELSLLAAHPSRTKIYCPACTTHAAISYFIRDSANESYTNWFLLAAATTTTPDQNRPAIPASRYGRPGFKGNSGSSSLSAPDCNCNSFGERAFARRLKRQPPFRCSTEDSMGRARSMAAHRIGKIYGRGGGKMAVHFSYSIFHSTLSVSYRGRGG